MRKSKWWILAVTAGCLAISSVWVNAEHWNLVGPFGFEPIAASAKGDGSDFDVDAPWILPPGFVQFVVSDESDLDIYTVPTSSGGRSSDWHDMNIANETGKHAGRYLYRTHEVRGVTEQGGGVVSVVDLKTGESKILVKTSDLDAANSQIPLDALDGIEWTPWGTLLFAEEVDGGRLFEVILDKDDPSIAVAVFDRPALGRLAHEGIAVGPGGEIYVIDENRGEDDGFGGGIYKFVPKKHGDLSAGDLYALKVNGTGGVGQGEWVGPINPADAPMSGTAFGGTGYNRPEDLQIIGNTLYCAVTEGTRVGGTEVFDGRVLAINLSSLRVTNFVKPGVNVPVEIGSTGTANPNYKTGFDNPDNLAKTPDGRLVIVEDNVPSDIWICDRDRNNDGVADSVSLFASLTDRGAEGTGIYFGKDPDVMFVNVQHSILDDNDATWAIMKVDHGNGKGKKK